MFQQIKKGQKWGKKIVKILFNFYGLHFSGQYFNRFSVSIFNYIASILITLSVKKINGQYSCGQ